MRNFKLLFLSSTILMAACSTNPATGNKQFAGLMSPQQEVQVGASEHEKIIQQYGLYENAQIQAYVNEIGNRITADTERPDVQYKFFVVDSPIVNAFALPGGYIYISRGLLALANSEAEVAAVLSHEAGHITARHSAERYSRGVVTTLGAGVLGAVIGNAGASQALGVGANLYLSSYSRSQESESDGLGLRYMTRGGYSAQAMPDFLYSLQRQSEIESRLAGREGTGDSYFSTHPATAERVAQTRNQASVYPKDGGVTNHDRHLKMIDGMLYGDSAKQGFARGQKFYHPEMNFTFEVPSGFSLQNQPAQVVATNKSGAAIVFDMASAKGVSPTNYIQSWVEGKPVTGLENITVNGMPAATASFQGTVNNQAMNIRLVAIQFGSSYARFMMAVPTNVGDSLSQDLQRTTYSFRNLTASEKNSIRPQRVDIFTAGAGDSVQSMSRRQPFDQLQEERFRTLNGLGPNENLVAGRLYKTIVE